jgi:hypothetical protein
VYIYTCHTTPYPPPHNKHPNIHNTPNPTNRKVLRLADKGPFWTQMLGPDYGRYIYIGLYIWLWVGGCAFLSFFFPVLPFPIISLQRPHPPIPKTANCDAYWQWNLLYVNNLIDETNDLGQPGMCYPVSWYLGVDFQVKHYTVCV